MISSITLKNFQSHKDSVIEFGPGVNVITGNSDSGKSAVLRSLYWVQQNRPAPATLLSHWAKDKDDKQTEPIEVTLKTDANEITRFKGVSQNCYSLNDSEYEAIGKDVPEAVQRALNMSDVNIQKQLDAPFLLSESAGEIARFFNNIIKLDDIDKCLSSADSLKRQNNSELRLVEEQKKQISASLEGYNWLVLTSSALAKLENMEERLTLLKGSAENIEKHTIEHKDITENLAKYRNLDNITKKAQEIGQMGTELEQLQDDSTYISELIKQYRGLEHNINSIPDTEGPTKNVEELKKQNSELMTLSNTAGDLTEAIDALKQGKTIIQALTKRMTELTASLPPNCVVCGAPLGKDGKYKCVE